MTGLPFLPPPDPQTPLQGLIVTTLALDLGTTTGFAFRDAFGGVKSGTWSLKPGKFDGAGMRGVKFVGHLDELKRHGLWQRIVFEAVRRHIGTDAAHIYGGLMLVLQTWCELNNVPHDGIPVQTIKKFWTGKGNANKAAMIAEAQRRGFTALDDNEVDAIALLHCAEATI
jgi:hypothetical protein